MIDTEAKLGTKATEAFTAMGAACKEAADALVKFVRATVDYVCAAAREGNIAPLLKAAKAQVALNEASPRVRHLANHSKKYRTQKKNINRAVREYQRRQKSDRTRTSKN